MGNFQENIREWLIEKGCDRPRQLMLAAVAALILAGVVGYWLVGKNVTVKATLGGEVTSACPVGTAVSEGDTLVRVKGLTGEVAAARATADGEVVTMKARAGSQISPQEAVATIRRK